MALTDITLTIAIPTYNRSEFLDRALHYIHVQLSKKAYPVELIVSDNFSTDNTQEVVESYITKGLPIRYLKNTENKGPDFNINQCYLEAKGKYVIALGDDDILIDGAIDNIIKILTDNDYGVVFLNQTPVKEGFMKFEGDKVDSRVFYNSGDFFKELSYYITFISANIVNKNYLDTSAVNNHLGTNLTQVPFICNAILQAPENLYIDTQLLGAADVSNSGGYNVFKVFGENLIEILNKILGGTRNDYLIKIVKNDLLTKLFPFWIIRFKDNTGTYEMTNSMAILYKYFKYDIKYWIIIIPIYYILPGKLSNYYLSALRRLKII